MTRLKIPGGIIRAIRKSDVEQLSKISREQEVMDHYFVTRETSQIELYWQKALASQDNNLVIDLAGEVGGYVKYGEFADMAEISYFLGKQFRGRGVMTRSLREVIKDIFSNPLFQQVHAAVNNSNTSSINVLLRAGLTKEREGIHMRSLVGCREGSLYKITREDFERLNF